MDSNHRFRLRYSPSGSSLVVSAGPFHASLPKTKFAADSALEERRFEPPVPLANQRPNYQVGLTRYRRTGAGQLVSQLAESARLTIDDPTVLGDRRNFTRPLQHGNVGNRVAVPNHDVGQLAGQLILIEPQWVVGKRDEKFDQLRLKGLRLRMLVPIGGLRAYQSFSLS